MIRQDPPDEDSTGYSFLCSKHFGEVKAEIEQLANRVLEAQTRSQEGQCFMCEVPAVEGRTCETCGCSLHPQWPAVYCSVKCALEDT